VKQLPPEARAALLAALESDRPYPAISHYDEFVWGSACEWLAERGALLCESWAKDERASCEWNSASALEAVAAEMRKMVPTANSDNDDRARVYVRARTGDDRWASVNVLDLDDRSFRVFVLRALVDAGLVTSVRGAWDPLTTPLTKFQVERGTAP